MGAEPGSGGLCTLLDSEPTWCLLAALPPFGVEVTELQNSTNHLAPAAAVASGVRFTAERRPGGTFEDVAQHITSTHTDTHKHFAKAFKFRQQPFTAAT